MRRLVYLLPMVLFLVLALYFAASLRPGYDPHVLPSAMLDKPAPAFSLTGLTEGALSLRGLAGQPAVINFFASWCVPCRIEHPVLMRLAREDHVRIYGIAYKDKPADAARLLAQFGDPYQATGLDRDGQVGLDFGVYGVPETYVLDKTGTIRKRFVGPLTDEAVETELLPLLKALNGS
jgi:cytochrome c biogenesis protein CcmG/thiol:disulfide interchange protein DsbE